MNKQKEIAQATDLYSNKSSKENMQMIQETQLTKASDFAKMVFSMQKTPLVPQTK